LSSLIKEIASSAVLIKSVSRLAKGSRQIFTPLSSALSKELMKTSLALFLVSS